MRVLLYDNKLTDISWRTAGRGHHAVLHRLRQAEITDHDLSVHVRVVVQQVLRLLGGETEGGRNRDREVEREERTRESVCACT